MKKLLLLLFIPTFCLGRIHLKGIKPKYFTVEDLYFSVFALTALTLALAYFISIIFKRVISNLQQRNINILYFVFAILTPLIISLYYGLIVYPNLKPGPIKAKVVGLLPELLIFSLLTYILIGFIIYRLKRSKKTANMVLRIFEQLTIACLLLLSLMGVIYGIGVCIELSNPLTNFLLF